MVQCQTMPILVTVIEFFYLSPTDLFHTQLADMVISPLTTQSFTSHYCCKTKTGRKNYEPLRPEIPTLPVKAFKKSLDLLSD